MPRLAALRRRLAALRRRLAALPRRLADRRAWGLAVLLLAWYALGSTLPDAHPAHPLMAPAFGVMFVYLLTLGAVVLLLNLGIPAFWIGFAVFCLLLAALLLAVADRLA